jgi:hypothetical protein
MVAVTGAVNEEKAAVRSGYYLLALVMLAQVLSFLDRVVLGLLVRPIRADLQISDTQMGLLFGAIFAVPYVLASLPALLWELAKLFWCPALTRSLPTRSHAEFSVAPWRALSQVRLSGQGSHW